MEKVILSFNNVEDAQDAGREMVAAVRGTRLRLVRSTIVIDFSSNSIVACAAIDAAGIQYSFVEVNPDA